MTELATLPNLKKIVGDYDFTKDYEPTATTATPIIKLMQKTSPALEENDNLKPGDNISTLTGKIYGDKKKPLRVIPIYWQKEFIKTVTKFHSGDERSEVTPKHGWVQCGRIDDANPDVREKVRKNLFKMPVIFEEDLDKYAKTGEMPIPHLLQTDSFKSIYEATSPIVNLHNYIRNLRPAPPCYIHCLSIETVTAKNDKGSWLHWRIASSSVTKRASVSVIDEPKKLELLHKFYLTAQKEENELKKEPQVTVVDNNDFF
jgi:hypothetical protein